MTEPDIIRIDGVEYERAKCELRGGCCKSWICVDPRDTDMKAYCLRPKRKRDEQIGCGRIQIKCYNCGFITVGKVVDYGEPR